MAVNWFLQIKATDSGTSLIVAFYIRQPAKLSNVSFTNPNRPYWDQVILHVFFLLYLQPSSKMHLLRSLINRSKTVIYVPLNVNLISFYIDGACFASSN